MVAERKVALRRALRRLLVRVCPGRGGNRRFPPVDRQQQLRSALRQQCPAYALDAVSAGRGLPERRSDAYHHGEPDSDSRSYDVAEPNAVANTEPVTNTYGFADSEPGADPNPNANANSGTNRAATAHGNVSAADAFAQRYSNGEIIGRTVADAEPNTDDLRIAAACPNEHACIHSHRFRFARADPAIALAGRPGAGQRQL